MKEILRVNETIENMKNVFYGKSPSYIIEDMTCLDAVFKHDQNTADWEKEHSGEVLCWRVTVRLPDTIMYRGKELALSDERLFDLNKRTPLSWESVEKRILKRENAAIREFKEYAKPVREYHDGEYER